MKFGLFYEVQTPKPLDSEDWPAGYEARKFKETLDQIELADKVGFDYLWVAEHHSTGEYTHTSAPDLLLAAASQRTRQMRLGTGVIQMPPGQNHPARVAERMATVDVLSGGRLEFGTGIGGPAEISFFIPDLTDAKGMWRESTRECLRMMGLTPYPAYHGQYLDMPTTNIIPKPLQRPHPPAWVACVRMETTSEAAANGMGALSLGLGGPEDAQRRVEAYWSAFHAGIKPIGLAINPAIVSFVMAMCAPTDAEARERERDGAAYFNFALSRSFELTRVGHGHIHREFVARQAQPSQGVAVVPEAAPLRANFADPRGGIVGSPATLARRIREYEATHVDALTFIIQCGDRRHEDIMQAIELIGTQVLPEFDERHPEHQEWRRRQIGEVPYPVNSSI